MRYIFRKGFTIVEVLLVLTITTLMLIAFMSTISYRVGRERYLDATRTFADFLRSIYSEVENVENGRTGSIGDQNKYCTLAGQAAHLENGNIQPNTGNSGEQGYGYVGRSGCAIYGKLISFNEDAENNEIYVYDVIGKAIDFRSNLSGDSVATNLKSLYADIMSFTPDESGGTYSLTAVGAVEPFYPVWDSWPENPDGSRFGGEILIVRSPTSGAIHTLVLRRTISFQKVLTNSAYHHNPESSLPSVINFVNSNGANMSNYLNDGGNSSDSFMTEELDLCLSSGDVFSHVFRRNNIRIAADGHDSTAVQIVQTDTGDNRC